MAAIIKASILGAKTNDKSLSDNDGNLSPTSTGDAELNAMREEGWEWTAFVAEAEEALPQLPDLFQRGLNATHSMAAECSELEVASSISEFKELSGGNATWQECTEAAIAGNPPCEAYAHQLAKICELYGGGAGSPLIKKLDAFAKRFTANVKLGEEFVSAIAELSAPRLCACARAQPWLQPT